MCQHLGYLYCTAKNINIIFINILVQWGKGGSFKYLTFMIPNANIVAIIVTYILLKPSNYSSYLICNNEAHSNKDKQADEKPVSLSLTSTHLLWLFMASETGCQIKPAPPSTL